MAVGRRGDARQRIEVPRVEGPTHEGQPDAHGIRLPGAEHTEMGKGTTPRESGEPCHGHKVARFGLDAHQPRHIRPGHGVPVDDGRGCHVIEDRGGQPFVLHPPEGFGAQRGRVVPRDDAATVGASHKAGHDEALMCPSGS